MIRRFEDFKIDSFYALLDKQNISDPYLRSIEVLKILSDDPNFESKPIQDIKNYKINLDFLSSEPQLINIKTYKEASSVVKSYGLYVQTEFTTGQWIDFDAINKQPDGADKIVNTLALLLIKQGMIYFDETQDDIEDVKNIIRNKMNIIVVLSLMDFFIYRSKILCHPILLFLTDVTMKQKVAFSRFSRMNFLLSMGI